MKTLQDLYKEIMESDELKKAFVEAMKSDNVKAFLEEHGCDVTHDELLEFLAGKAAEDSPLTLDPDTLAKVAGGDITESIPTDSLNCTHKDTCNCSDTCIRDCC